MPTNISVVAVSLLSIFQSSTNPACFLYSIGWKIIFSSLWKTFDLQFQAILTNLKKHRDLIDSEASSRNVVEAKAWRSQQLEEFRQLRSERAKDAEKAEKDHLNSCMRDALLWLGATNPTNAQEDSLEKLSREPGDMDSQ